MMVGTELSKAMVGFDLVKRIYDGIGDKPRFEPYYTSESVLNLTSDSDQENMIFLYRTLGARVKDLDNICEVVQSDPYYIKDKLLPAVSTVLWAEQFSERIKERLKEGAFDDNEPIKKEMDVITIYLDYSCQKVGALLHAGLGMIWDQKTEVLNTVVDSIGPNSSRMLQIQQRMQEIDNAVQVPQNLNNLVGAVQGLTGSVDWQSIGPQSDPNATNDLYLSRWLHFCQDLQSLQSTVDRLGLKEWFSLNRQALEMTKLFDEVLGSFNEIPNIQEQLGTLIQRTSGYQNVPYTDLLELNRTIEPPVPVRSQSSETSEGSGPQTGIMSLLGDFFRSRFR